MFYNQNFTFSPWISASSIVKQKKFLNFHVIPLSYPRVELGRSKKKNMECIEEYTYQTAR